MARTSTRPWDQTTLATPYTFPESFSAGTARLSVDPSEDDNDLLEIGHDVFQRAAAARHSNTLTSPISVKKPVFDSRHNHSPTSARKTPTIQSVPIRGVNLFTTTPSPSRAPVATAAHPPHQRDELQRPSSILRRSASSTGSEQRASALTQLQSLHIMPGIDFIEKRLLELVTDLLQENSSLLNFTLNNISATQLQERRHRSTLDDFAGLGPPLLQDDADETFIKAIVKVCYNSGLALVTGVSHK
jgi:hypothetical protein